MPRELNLRPQLIAILRSSGPSYEDFIVKRVDEPTREPQIRETLSELESEGILGASRSNGRVLWWLIGAAAEAPKHRAPPENPVAEPGEVDNVWVENTAERMQVEKTFSQICDEIKSVDEVIDSFVGCRILVQLDAFREEMDISCADLQADYLLNRAKLSRDAADAEKVLQGGPNGFDLREIERRLRLEKTQRHVHTLNRLSSALNSIAAGRGNDRRFVVNLERREAEYTLVGTRAALIYVEGKSRLLTFFETGALLAAFSQLLPSTIRGVVRGEIALASGQMQSIVGEATDSLKQLYAIEGLPEEQSNLLSAANLEQAQKATSQTLALLLREWSRAVLDLCVVKEYALAPVMEDVLRSVPDFDRIYEGLS